VRNCSGRIFQWPAKSPEERCRALGGPDGSRIESQQFLSRPRIVLVSGRVSRGADNCGPNHLIQWQVSEPDNRNPKCTNRLDAGAGICNRRGFDFEDAAREYVRSRSRSCGDNVRESLRHDLTIAISYEKGNQCPSPQSSPPQAGRGGLSSRLWEEFNKWMELMTKCNTSALLGGQQITVDPFTSRTLLIADADPLREDWQDVRLRARACNAEYNDSWIK
jgi:hypothetical protein